MTLRALRHALVGIAAIAALLLVTLDRPQVVIAQTAGNTHVHAAASLPATCRVGDSVYKTGASAGFYLCSATNTWTGPYPTSAGAGTVTTSGSPANGDIAKFSSGTAVTNATTTGSGSVVLATSPTLITPLLGTPTSGTLTNATGLPLAGLVAPSDDQTLVSNGTAVQAKTLPDCTDTGGNHLNYAQGSNAFSCGTSGAGGGGGGVTLLEQHAASASASLDFTTCLSSTYDDYQIEFVNVVPATNAADLHMRMSTNGGSSYDSTSIYGYGIFSWRAGATGVSGSEGAASAINVSASGVGNASGRSLNGWLRYFGPLSTTTHKELEGFTKFFNSAGSFRIGAMLIGSYESLTAANAFQFFFSSGNITSGTIRCYGLAK